MVNKRFLPAAGILLTLLTGLIIASYLIQTSVRDAANYFLSLS